MSTVTFQSVMENVATRLGVEPDELPRGQAAAAALYIGDQLKTVWDKYDWPFTRITEARVYAQRWDEITSADIVVAMIVYHLGSYWKALVSEATDEPSAGSDEWVLTDSPFRIISLDQPGQTPIAQVLGVYTADPDTDPCAVRLPFCLDASGIRLRTCAPAEVWVKFSIECPQVTSREWSSATNYQVGSVVYYPATGDCYRCLVAHANQAPEAGGVISTYWRKQLFPAELKLWSSLGAAMDALDEDGATEKAIRMQSRAENALADQLEILLIKQGQTNSWRRS